YPPAFYKLLHRYVHKSYRWHMALGQLRHLLRHPAAITKAGLQKAASLAWYGPASVIDRIKLARYEFSGQAK
ncbi:MAG TPA: hypothetical protein VI233_04965, partial [Puia sp.]